MRLGIVLGAWAAFMAPATAAAHPGDWGLADEPANPARDNSPTSRPKITEIQAGWLLAIPGQTPLQKRTIIIRDGHISEIRQGFVGAEAFPGSEVSVVDLRDAYVLPGLMDVHVHLSTPTGGDKSLRLRGIADEMEGPTSAQRGDVTGMVTAIGNAHKTLMAGYTTVRNVGSDGLHITALRDAIAAGKLEGPRIFTAGAIIYPGSDYGDGACSGVESCRRATRRQIDRGVDLIKIYATCSGSKPCGRQDAPSTFLPDELEAIVQTAHSRQLKVAAHAHGEDGIRAALRAGVDSIEHGSYTPADAIPMFKEHGTFLVPTLSVQDNIRRDIKTATGDMHDVMANFLANHGPRMMAAYKAGVRIAAGSDAGVAEHGNNAHELELYVREGMPAADAIKAATVNAAALIGHERDLGTLEPGRIADIIAVRADPLQDIKALKNVRFVMKEGAIYRSEGAQPDAMTAAPK